MIFPYKDEILSLEAFRKILPDIKEADLEMGTNIEEALKVVVSESHELLIAANTHDQLQLALLKEQLLIQAQSSQYLNITDELTTKKVNLLEFLPKVYNEFMDDLERDITLFMRKTEAMCKEVEKEGAWYSGLRDTTKKGGGTLLNAAMKTINTSTRKINGKEAIKDTYLVDTKTMVEEILEKHLSQKQVADFVCDALSESSKRYKDKWIKQIAGNIPDIKRLTAFSMAGLAKDKIKIDFQLGLTEQVLVMGLGSAVVGAAWLAIGWHTLTYAMMNVFPPIAVFAAIATLLVGVLTKDKAVEKRKKDIKEAVNRYHSFFLQQLYVLKLPELGHQSLSKYMENQGSEIVDEAIKTWERHLFGKLNTDHFRKLNQAFVRHLMYVNEALES